jgi:hypothetical protein
MGFDLLVIALAAWVCFGLEFSLSGKLPGVSPANFCTRIHSRVLPRAEGSSMSFVAWKILRKLPRSLLRVGVVFLLVSAAHAYF